MASLTVDQNEIDHEFQADIELGRLWREASKKTSYMIGGRTPAEMEARNELIRREFRRQRLEILAEHGLIQLHCNLVRQISAESQIALVGLDDPLTHIRNACLKAGHACGNCAL